MKKIFNFATVAVFAILMSSCTKEVFDTPETDFSGEDNKFTFILPAERSVIAYAGAVPASESEKALDLANTSVYMFAKTSDGSGKLEAVLTGSDLTAGTGSGGKKTLSIEIKDGWSGNKTFYIVGNTNMGAATALGSVVVNTTTEAGFEDLVTVSQGTSLITSTSGLLMAGSVDVNNVEQAGSGTISLYRSVARFDINNDVTQSNVTINSINVTKANLQGYVNAYGLEVAAGTPFATGNLPSITVADPVAGSQKAEGAFYLYPTQLKTDGSGTVITLSVSVSGADQVYTLNKEASNLPVDCFIKANTRYTISTIDADAQTFAITIEDWDEGGELIGRPNGTTPPVEGEVMYPTSAGNLPAVKFGGLWWAPVNVGATTINGTTNFSDVGYYFQYGRNVAHTQEMPDVVQGPVTLKQSREEYPNSFISSSSAYSYEWMNDEDSKKVVMTNLWKPSSSESICPEDWRVPSSAELETIKNAYAPTKFNAEKKRLEIEGNDGNMLYFPANGLLSNNGILNDLGSVGHYWSYSFATGSTSSFRLRFTDTASTVASNNRSYGFAVRCVKNAN